MTDPRRYPLDELQKPSRTISVDAGNTARTLNLVIYVKPFDLSQPEELDELRATLGNDAVLPDNDGVWYLFSTVPDDRRGMEHGDVPFLVPEGAVQHVLFGMGIRDSITTAQQFQSRRGQLPLHDALDSDQA